MNDLPRRTLARIVAEHGREISGSPKRVEALLRDLCGAHRREINVIVGALEERVAADMMSVGKSVPRDALLARLTSRLHDNLAYTPEAARWAVDTWALALGVLTEAEVEQRERAATKTENKTSAPAADRSPPTRQPSPVPPPTTVRDTNVPLPRTPTQTPPTRKPSPTMPPASRQPSIVTPRPTAAPTQHAPTTYNPPRTRQPLPSPQAPAPPLPQQDPDPAPSPRRGLTLRGCLFGFVLIVALIVGAVFVLPVVISVLREEQAQPSINDPRPGDAPFR